VTAAALHVAIFVQPYLALNDGHRVTLNRMDLEMNPGVLAFAGYVDVEGV
jgi:hypothetical protein